MLINRTELKTLWIVVIATTVFSCIQWRQRWLESFLESINRVAAHLIIESLSFSICIALLILGWIIFVPTLSRQRLIMAALFSGIGLLDLLHAVS